MTKRELIQALEASPFPDETPVKIYDHRKCVYHDSGDDSAYGIHDFDVSSLNDDLTEDEKQFIIEQHEINPIVMVVLAFDNDDYDDEGNCLLSE